ncbi:DUF7574 domain-containing protein [Microbacterium sp. XT11]|uniref:DUF7574 domain-containing protein n=1 Tax=Microbacterium sp. XT11 TaxID=367477 RepID=UPI00082F75FA|nr:hypothetical protein [Microbacterium sp. XT11]
MAAFTKYDFDKGEDVALPGTEDFVQVGDAYAGGWNWSNFSAYYSPSRDRYYWLDEGGCSCSGPGDSVYSVADFQEGSREELTRAAKASVVVGGYAGDDVWTQDHRDRLLDAIRRFDPTKASA